MNKVYTQIWLDLPREIRDHLMKVFGIIKTGVAEVRDQTVVSDGVTNDDLSVISDAKMTEYVGSVEEFHKLWQLTVSKANYELHPPIDILDLADLGFKEVTNEEFSSFQNAKPQLGIQTEDKTKELQEVNPSTPLISGIPEEKTKFCDSCDSKGGFHLKDCLNNK